MFQLRKQKPSAEGRKRALESLKKTLYKRGPQKKIETWFCQLCGKEILTFVEVKKLGIELKLCDECYKTKWPKPKKT